MCAEAAECETLTQLAVERGLRLGVAHNFLFAGPFEQLRQDMRSGVLGKIDAVTITWNRELPQAVHGPFDIWMLRDSRNILTEVGSHCVAQMLDLVGEPEEISAHASNAVELPTGVRFYRRWQVSAIHESTAVELRLSFVPGFAEYNIHVRGSLAAATADFESNTYTLQQHRPKDPDFDRYAMIVDRASSLKRQARRTLWKYVAAKMKLGKRGNPYGESIARAMDAFYAPELDARMEGGFGASVVRICRAMAESAMLPAQPEIVEQPEVVSVRPKVLVLGGGGFVGKELVRQMTAAGEPVRLLLRNVASLPRALRGPTVECQAGDIRNRQQLLRAMEGVDCVVHLARANVKTWAEYEELEIGATQLVAECALQAGVKRMVYTGTIDSYYAGRRAGTITEATPLDAKIARRNLYARAKAESEALLMRLHRDKGLPLVIVRPGIVIGRGGSPFHWGVGMWWNQAVCQVWGKGKNKLPLVLVEDVARGLRAAMIKPGIEGQSFNLIGEPCLSAQEYLDELDRCGGIRVQREATPIISFYWKDMMKWVVKVMVRHKERQLPSYRDWESRTQRANFDCSAARTILGWQPVQGREELVRLGIEEPVRECCAHGE
jgi:nucleoside-diphosphate-sugar epimerase/predicted dehydrogenase